MYRGQISVRKEEMEGFIRVAENLQVHGILKCRESLKAFSATRDPAPPHSDHTYTYSPNSRSQRTQFTGLQLKVLQEHFEKNSYCDPTKLEYLAGQLDLNPRVIQVWFQNARQKTRKIQEKQTSVESGNSHYECKKCLEQFQTYLDLIIHQVQPCQEEEEEEEDKIINIVVPDCEAENQGQYQYQSSRASTDSDCVPVDEIALPDQLEQLLEQFEQFSEEIREDQLAAGTTEDLMERDENENRKRQGGAEDCETGGLVIDEAQLTSRPRLRIVNVKTLQPTEWNNAEDSLSATGEVLHGEITLFTLLNVNVNINEMYSFQAKPH